MPTPDPTSLKTRLQDKTDLKTGAAGRSRKTKDLFLFVLFCRIHSFEILFRIWDDGAVGKVNAARLNDLSLDFNHPSARRVIAFL